nr:hypothetical protein [Brevundimonas diminuta]
MSNEAARLLEALDLKVVAGGPNGRYPRAEPGPAQGYRYWANMAEGQLRLGVQSNPKVALAPALIEQFRAQGFQIMPASTEAFAWLGSDFDGAVDRGRATISAIEAVLG